VQVGQFFSFERRHSAPARHTSFVGKFRHGSQLPTYAPLERRARDSSSIIDVNV
jgi:hypothetical protein